MTPVVVYDATHENVPNLPPGPAAGYTTGSSWIQWTDADWSSHPGAVRIDQDWKASDYTADVLDVESGAATPSECADWWRRVTDNYTKQTRPGQRLPAIYGNQSTLPLVAQALRAAGITSGPVFWVARVTDQKTAEGMIGRTFSGFPVIGVQFDYTHPAYDVNVFDSGWLNPDPAPKPIRQKGSPTVHYLRTPQNGTYAVFPNPHAGDPAAQPILTVRVDLTPDTEDRLAAAGLLIDAHPQDIVALDRAR